MSEKHDPTPDDLTRVAEQLTAARPTLSSERLALTKEGVLTRVRATPGRGTPGKRLWRPRLVLTGMLVLGIMLSTTGVGLAISGLASSGSAGKAQYGSPGGAVKGKRESSGGRAGVGTRQTAGQEAGGANVAGQTQATTGKAGLPFTGLASIPLILVGGTLLVTGIGLRRRTRRT